MQVISIMTFGLLASKNHLCRALTSTIQQAFRNSLRPRHHLAMFTSTLVVASTKTSFSLCQGGDDEVLKVPSFEESVLEFDHYNGVTLYLDKMIESSTFADNLKEALSFWKAEGRKGIWIHVSTDKAHLIPLCTDLGFSFHFVREKTLILSQWLPEHVPSKLPFGPTHQVGVGALVLNPSDLTEMLVVKEKSGPAAAYDLWKMPTGLLDPGEDIPEAAIRELQEETGLDGSVNGIVCFRQAHRPSSSSDLFFVCRLMLEDPAAKWKPQEDEIADIQWMSVEDYCNQDRWQGSPVYLSLNDSIRKTALAAQQCSGSNVNGMIIYETLPVGFGRGTNALFKSQL